MNGDRAGSLSPAVTTFVEAHVHSLLAWDIIVYFVRNPHAVLDHEGLAELLGRNEDETSEEVQSLAATGVLSVANWLIRFAPEGDVQAAAAGFVEACEDRQQRLSLIAMVLERVAAQQQT